MSVLNVFLRPILWMQFSHSTYQELLLWLTLLILEFGIGMTFGSAYILVEVARIASMILALSFSTLVGFLMLTTRSPEDSKSSCQCLSVRSIPAIVIIPISSSEPRTEAPVLGSTISAITIREEADMAAIVCLSMLIQALSGQSWKMCRKKYVWAPTARSC